MTPEQAEAEMVEGFRDGYDRDAPEPSENRSVSYRHGFFNGRHDIGLNPHGYNADQLRAMAANAIQRDTCIWLN